MTMTTTTMMDNSNILCPNWVGIISEIEKSLTQNEKSELERVQNYLSQLFSENSNIADCFYAVKLALDACANGYVCTAKYKDATMMGNQNLLDQIKIIFKNNDNGLKMSHCFYFWDDIYTGQTSDNNSSWYNPKILWLEYLFIIKGMETAKRIGKMTWSDIDHQISKYYDNHRFMDFFRSYCS